MREFERFRLTVKEPALRDYSRSAARRAQNSHLEEPSDDDLFRIQNAADGVGELNFTASIFEDSQKAQDVHQQKSSNPEDPFPYLSAEERVVMDFFVSLPHGMTQRRKEMLLKSIQRKLEEAQIEREEDEAGARRQVPFGKLDQQSVAMRLERRNHYQALEDQFKKDKEEREKRERKIAPQIKPKELKPNKKKVRSQNRVNHPRKSQPVKPHPRKRLTSKELEAILAFIESSNQTQVA